MLTLVEHSATGSAHGMKKCTDRSKKARRYMMQRKGMTWKSILVTSCRSVVWGGHSTKSGVSATPSSRSYCGKGGVFSLYGAAPSEVHPGMSFQVVCADRSLDYSLSCSLSISAGGDGTGLESFFTHSKNGQSDGWGVEDIISVPTLINSRYSKHFVVNDRGRGCCDGDSVPRKVT
jgi:hypothetical protein